ncbi:hypothetical protein HK102_012540, partial [Quaeritorhiza haematococci]
FALFQNLINEGIRDYTKQKRQRDNNNSNSTATQQPSTELKNTDSNRKNTITSGKVNPRSIANNNEEELEETFDPDTPAYVDPKKKKKDRAMKAFFARIPVQQTEEFLGLFNDAKQWLASDGVLAIPCNPHVYIITMHMDTSLTRTNTIFMQTQPSGHTKPLAYFSKAITKVKRAFWPTELEAWGVMVGLEAGREYIDGDFTFGLVPTTDPSSGLKRTLGTTTRYATYNFGGRGSNTALSLFTAVETCT